MSEAVRSRVVVVVLAAILAACSSDATPPAPEAPPLPRLEPITTFGCADCEGPELLAQPTVSLGDSGRIYVTDNTEPFVRVLEQDGTLAFAIGRSGQAPGEIRLPILLGVVEDGEDGFWLQEATFLHHFDRDGAVIETVAYRGRLPLGLARDQRRGRFYIIGAPLPTDGTADTPPRALLRITPGEPEPETVAPWDVVVGDDPKRSGEQARWSILAVAPDGSLAVVEIWGYRVRVLSPSGTFLREFGRPELERPLKSEDRLRAQREMAERQGRDEPSPEDFHVGYAGYDGAGRLWLHAVRGPNLLDVFSADGTYLGSVSVPEPIGRQFPSLSVHGDRLAAITYDETGVGRVRVFRIVEG